MPIQESVFKKEDICAAFNISLATVNNWIKTELIPAPSEGGYSKKKYTEIIEKIKCDSDKLKMRANRSFLHESDTVFLGIKDKARKSLLINLIACFKQSGYSIFQGVCALGARILICNNLYDKKSSIYEELEKEHKDVSIFNDFFIKNENDDILGAFYQSVQSTAKKSSGGSYYTPAELLKHITIPDDAKVLDPCCGSGSILIHTLSRKHNPSLVWASDIDDIALLICRINLILFFESADIHPHIEKNDLIFDREDELFAQAAKEKFDLIITNPPWGSKITRGQKDFLLSHYPMLNTTEVFSIALFNAVHRLNEQGLLFFFLPESILTVASHKNIRKFLLQTKRDIDITPFGAAFKGVQSECVLIKLSEKKNIPAHLYVKTEHTHEIALNKICAPDYIIPYNVSENEAVILDKLYAKEHTTLPIDTIFALGIVTGNNKKYLLNKKIGNAEPIFRGKDITPYSLKNPEVFVELTPYIFQQVAPVEHYRSRKIIYKFISDKIICVLDEKQHLVLNSANVIISNSYPMEILVCLLNSSIYSFIYQKKFKSKKVLKQHLKDFPLPVLSDTTQGDFIYIYNQIMNGMKSQKDADELICKYFALSNEDYDYIQRSIYGNTGERA